MIDQIVSDPFLAIAAVLVSLGAGAGAAMLWIIHWDRFGSTRTGRR